jgi:putative nucleotidyltransferase with HDIG domain
MKKIEEMRMMEALYEAVRKPYCESRHYSGTIWLHARNVAENARHFAEQLGVNQHIAQAGGILHDLGAAIHGRTDHHLTGMREAVPVLQRCGFPKNQIGRIVHCVFAHRGSQNIPAFSMEAECVRAGDGKDHMRRVDVLWQVQLDTHHLGPEQAYLRVVEELNADLAKTHSSLKRFLEPIHRLALQRVLDIYEGRIAPVLDDELSSKSA